MAETNNPEVEENNEVVNEALKFLEGTAPFIMENDMVPHVYSNDPYNPVPYGLLDILYRQVFENRVGIMHAKDATTGDVVPVICFVGDRDNEDVALYPIARMLTEDEVGNYLAPVGDGEYFEHSTDE
nr:MAG TPA_asm: hypothetical protein [Caudoviricetes sp.]